MLKRLAFLILAASFSLAVLPSEQADARYRGHAGYRPTIYYGAYARPVYFSRARYYPPYYYRPYYARPVYSYAYVSRPVAYDDGCHWLKRRAIHTHSPYWWDRYRACRGYYY